MKDLKEALWVRKRDNTTFPFAAIAFATATLDKELEQDDGKLWMGKGTQIICVEVSSSHTMDGVREIVSINEDLQLYRDSIATCRCDIHRHNQFVGCALQYQ